MLVIKDVADLKKYLETRKEMAANQTRSRKLNIESDPHTRGMIYAFDEAIKAVEALANFQSLDDGKETKMRDTLTISPEKISETLERR